MIKWIEGKYNTTRVQTPIGTLAVYWDGAAPKGSNPGYRVSVFGRQLKATFHKRDEAKKVAVEAARRLLRETTDLLGTGETP